MKIENQIINHDNLAGSSINHGSTIIGFSDFLTFSFSFFFVTVSLFEASLNFSSEGSVSKL
jgi:hypothetical protein